MNWPRRSLLPHSSQEPDISQIVVDTASKPAVVVLAPNNAASFAAFECRICEISGSCELCGRSERRGQFIHYSLVRDNLVNTLNGYVQGGRPGVEAAQAGEQGAGRWALKRKRVLGQGTWPGKSDSQFWIRDWSHHPNPTPRQTRPGGTPPSRLSASALYGSQGRFAQIRS